MTGRELLAEAKKHFPVLYGGSAVDAYDHLITQALATFQDKAGYMGSIQTPEGAAAVAIPSGFLALISVHDAEKQFHEAVVDDTTITVQEQANSVRPYTIHYFVDLRAYDVATDALPPDIIGVLLDYLVALIDIPNTARARRVALATGQQIEVRGDEELLARKQTLEDLMEQEYAIIPPIMVGS
jgi:hypothetical protein